ncbi:tryptophan halogenase family protein [Gilvimarinus sp. DA14]|uniref:tryptophan halogenase family protein n=1 Tax=Gilvimarinus sp. DA14 TaxID=2956798 RepID=UPI0020B794D2|nr:tryptophan halogenase family protein [Gilvimarinus sp. DA14]UTF58663.1 tryptophan 7-halogenase [Gilvimarinus sp. DA14]
MSQGIKKIVIAGGGTAGWMSAALLSKAFGATKEIVLVESDEIASVGVGEATVPPLQLFHEFLEVDERDFMRSVDATFKLGIAFENWREPGHTYMHAFGHFGKDSWHCRFFNYWLAAAKDKGSADFEKYCLEFVAAQQNKFNILPNRRVQYAYHLDAGKYAVYLRRYSEAHGVTRVEGKIDAVSLNQNNGHISALQLQSGQRVEGDLFIDCTGFRALLIEGALHTGYEDWSHWLPCDSAYAVQSDLPGEIPPYTRSIANHAGWQWRIPLQSRRGNGHVFSSAFTTDQAALDLMLDSLDAKPINEPRLIRFKTGARRKQWHKNCVALGLSSGFLEPLESTSIHLVQRNLMRLIQWFPAQGINAAEVDEFNRQAREDTEAIRDFIIMHYKVHNRRDSDFWRHCGDMDVPDDLSHRIKLFKSSAKVFKRSYELFGEESWIQVFLGQGLMPKSYHPFVDTIPRDVLYQTLSELETSIRQQVSEMPSHGEFLARYCRPQS